MVISSEYVSDSFIHLNSCDCQIIDRKKAGSFRPHGRKDWHILYISEGTCHILYQGEEYSAPSGSLVIYPPETEQNYFFGADDFSVSYYAHFSGTCCDELLSSLSLCNFGVYRTGKSTELESAFSAMIAEHRLSRPYSAEITKSYLIGILSLAARKAALSSKNAAFLPPELYEKLFAEYTLNKNISEYASFCSMSVSRFTHVFTNENGISPKKYIVNLRMKKAAELLESTTLTIAEIANLTGFSDQNYFSRCFKKNFGSSPKSLRTSKNHIRKD